MKKKLLITAVSALLLQNSFAFELKNEFHWNGRNVKLNSKKNEVDVEINGVIVSTLVSKNTDNTEIKFIDANYDGYLDVLILRDAGIEKYFDVYLFNKKTGNFSKNAFLSKLACPEFTEKEKTIKSTCNHANACEKWEDTYKLKKNLYSLVYRTGETCNPANGEAFKYEEKYSNGIVIWQKTSRLPDK